jgi:UDP-N-acetylmuramate dehydrogenase
MSKLLEFKHPNVNFFNQIDLTNYSTMRLKASGDLFEVTNLDGLIGLVSFLSHNKIKYGILGWGANQPLPFKSELPFIKLDFEFDREVLSSFESSYLLPGSISLAVLTSAACRLKLGGWEVFSGIPASLGGAVAMNAGTGLGEIGQLVQEVHYVDSSGALKLHHVSDSSFSYRKNNFLQEGDIIYQVVLKVSHLQADIDKKISEYLKYRNKTQPMRAATCGCMFKNHNGEIYCRAGETIDILGMKGRTYKNLRISPVHANFLENLGGATLDDVKEFISIIQDEVFKSTGILFEPEIKI